MGKALVCVLLLLVGSLGAVTLVYPEEVSSEKIEKMYFKAGLLAFDKMPEITSIIAHFKKEYNIKNAFEFGTLKGETTVLLSMLFDKVYTVDSSIGNYHLLEKKLSGHNNIKRLLGSFTRIIDGFFPMLGKDNLFVYFNVDDLKLLNECLRDISCTHKDKLVLLINFAKPPVEGEKDLFCENIKVGLESVFTDHEFSYLMPHDGTKERAKLLVLPKRLSIQPFGERV